jgi:hypothetical protein
MWGKKRNGYCLLVERPQGKRPLGRPKRRWVDNIEMDFGKMDGVDWIGMAQDRYRWRPLVDAVMKLRIP